MKWDEILFKPKVFDWKIIHFLLVDFRIDKICLTFDRFSCQGQKLMRFRGYGVKFSRHFSKILHKSFRLYQNLTNNYDSLW
jgi:hypothetical protein